MFKTSLIAALALCFGWLNAATAEDSRPDTTTGKGRAELMKRFDTNHDGQLNDDERAAAKEQMRKHREERQEKFKENHPDLFAKADANGDGSISRDEFKAFHEKRQERREEAMQERNPEKFDKIDANDDGDISKDEKRQARQERAEKFKEKHPEAFDRADQNDDGALERGERKDLRRARREHRDD